MIGLNFFHVVAQAIEARKLFHIDLNDQKPGRFDQDLRFGSESIKALFFVVKLLEETGYEGPRDFHAHAYRTESVEGVWDFARGCMRTYLLLKEKGAAVLERMPRFKRCWPRSRAQAADIVIGPIQPAARSAAEGPSLRSGRRSPPGRCGMNVSISC